ncbi:MAG: alanine--tRNA ligase [Planctomycetes bacterium]|nr:alanine--tRNA ligase [Planctomycetota bacterium]
MTTNPTLIRTAAQIRCEFIEYFEKKQGHTFVPSSPVVPHDDPTLLFTNAGMNQFKEIFLGHGDRQYNRAVNTQKCIRAGGKHNDLEDVGKDNYHHTFFEMLGNWSFGDYFKKEAIEWAWDLLTNVWGLDKDRLHVTVFEGCQAEGTEPDIEAEEIWKQFVPADHITRWGKKDNFWEMGETGPCGPCSEIHYDFTPDKSGGNLVNADDPRVVELWNLVFIQYNRAQGGALSPLPAKHVDTGMGLERLVRILRNVESNYDTDLWTPIFDAITKHTGAHSYQGSLDDPVDVAYRVIADHIRCLTFAITDGAYPSNEGRGYVLRRILRRAVRHAHQTMQTKGAWLFELVPAVVNSLGEAFPELKEKPDKVAAIIRDEEEGFLRTLDRGIELFGQAEADALDLGVNRYVNNIGHSMSDHGIGDLLVEKSIWKRSTDGLSSLMQEYDKTKWPPDFHPEVSANDAFKLHDTYGFPIDLTRVMAQERGMTVDEAGYEKLMAEARKKSRKTTSDDKQQYALTPDILAGLKQLNVQPTLDEHKYDAKPLSAEVVAIFNGTDLDNYAHVGTEVAVILNRTNHYSESGGQVSDHGSIETDVFDLGNTPGRGYSGREATGDCTFRITDTKTVAGFVLHIGHVTEGKLHCNSKVIVTVNRDRRAAILSNHTTTHLLNHALRAIIGPEEDQKGSLVAPDRLRFDFSSSHAMDVAQIDKAERLVNAAIEQELTVYDEVVPLEKAKSISSLRAVFGEKYPDPVRVVSVGIPLKEVLADPSSDQWKEFSIELCGGTHLADTSAAKKFIITHETALAAGIRRIIALTGTAAIAAEAAGKDLQSRAKRAGDLSDKELTSEYEEITKLLEQLSISAVAQHSIEESLRPLKDRIKKLRSQARAESRAGAVDQARDIADSASGLIIIDQLLGADKETLRSALDVVRAKHDQAAIMLFTGDEIESKVAIAACVPETLIKKGLKAGDWVREAAKACGGGGGGRPNMAQAGGKDPEKIDDAITAAKVFAENAIT